MDADGEGRLKRIPAARPGSQQNGVSEFVDQATEDCMAERMQAFRALAERLRAEPGAGPRIPSKAPIREDRDRGRRSDCLGSRPH